jgi:hypothetical protein
MGDDDEHIIEMSTNQTKIARRSERFSQRAMVLAAHGHQEDSDQPSTFSIDEYDERIVEPSANQTKYTRRMINDSVQAATQ